MTISGYFHALWDCGGQGAVGILDIPMSDVSNESEGAGWRVVLYHYVPDVTPAYLDELLLSPGSLRIDPSLLSSVQASFPLILFVPPSVNTLMYADRFLVRHLHPSLPHILF